MCEALGEALGERWVSPGLCLGGLQSTRTAGPLTENSGLRAGRREPSSLSGNTCVMRRGEVQVAQGSEGGGEFVQSREGYRASQSGTPTWVLGRESSGGT